MIWSLSILQHTQEEYCSPTLCNNVPRYYNQFWRQASLATRLWPKQHYLILKKYGISFHKPSTLVLENCPLWDCFGGFQNHRGEWSYFFFKRFIFIRRSQMNLGKVMEEKRFSRRFWHLSLHSSRQMIREKSFPSLFSSLLSRYFWQRKEKEERSILLIVCHSSARDEVSLHPSLLCNRPHLMVRPIVP